MDIPEDVQRAAEAAQDAAMARCKAANFAVYEYPFNTGRAKDVLDEEIARAILAERERATTAERERCAKVATAIGKEYADPFFSPHIANAIRTPPEQPAQTYPSRGETSGDHRHP